MILVNNRNITLERLSLNHYFPIIAMMVSIPLIDYLRVIYSNSYPILFALLSLSYVFGYLYVLIFKVNQYSLRNIIFVLLSIKLYFFVTQLAGGSFQEASLGTSDWARFHIPKSLEYLNEGWSGVFESLFSRLATYNGRLTHVIIMLISLLISFLGLDGSSLENIAIFAYAFSLFICPIVIILFYKAAYLYSKSINFARRAAFFTALSPFFIATTSNPQKEILIYLSIGLLLIYLVSKEKNIKYLFFSLLIMFFERVYLLPLFIVMAMFAREFKITPFNYFMIFIGIALIEIFIGFERALIIHDTHVKSLISTGDSFLKGHDFFSNIIRGGFGPFFLRPLMNEVTSYTAIGISKYLLYLFFPYFFIKSFFCTDGVLKTMLFIYIFIIVLLPFHGTLKILLLTSFGGIFLDCISQVKYYNKHQCGVVSRLILFIQKK
jgi:hypothetical protein